MASFHHMPVYNRGVHLASFHDMPIYNWGALGLVFACLQPGHTWLVFATYLSTTGVHLASFGNMPVHNWGALG